MTGISEYCQECGACQAGSSCVNFTSGVTDAGLVTYCESVKQSDNPSSRSGGSIVDIIADEVTRTILAGIKPQQTKTQSCTDKNGNPSIPLGVSNRHMHITPETFAQLFGKGTEFEVYRDLYEPGEFASKHVVTVIGPKQKAMQLRILGPFRKYDQVEVSLTDSIGLGIRPPIGDLSKGAPLTIVGPKGSIYREHIAVIANRHVHMSPADADKFGVADGDFIRVRIPGEKGLIFENVLVRTHPTWKLMMHLDTDDANAAHVVCNTQVEFVGKM